MIHPEKQESTKEKQHATQSLQGKVGMVQHYNSYLSMSKCA